MQARQWIISSPKRPDRNTACLLASDSETSSPSSAEVKNVWSYTSSRLYTFMARTWNCFYILWERMLIKITCTSRSEKEAECIFSIVLPSKTPLMRGISWLDGKPVSFSRRTLLQEVSKQVSHRKPALVQTSHDTCRDQDTDKRNGLHLDETAEIRGLL
jgi:hypothetical protein